MSSTVEQVSYVLILAEQESGEKDQETVLATSCNCANLMDLSRIASIVDAALENYRRENLSFTFENLFVGQSWNVANSHQDSDNFPLILKASNYDSYYSPLVLYITQVPSL